MENLTRAGRSLLPSESGDALISIPIAILFLNLQKYYVNGMTGAVKE